MKSLCDSGIGTKEKMLAGKIKSAIGAVSPDATVVLFGSRARGGAQNDSDWDMLVLLDNPARNNEENILKAIFDIELEEDAIICPIILSREQWERGVYRNHPLRARIEIEGVLVA